MQALSTRKANKDHVEIKGLFHKTMLKSKEYSTTRPMEFVHIDLVRQTTTKGLKGEKFIS